MVTAQTNGLRSYQSKPAQTKSGAASASIQLASYQDGPQEEIVTPPPTQTLTDSPVYPTDLLPTLTQGSTTNSEEFNGPSALQDSGTTELQTGEFGPQVQMAATPQMPTVLPTIFRAEVQSSNKTRRFDLSNYTMESTYFLEFSSPIGSYKTIEVVASFGGVEFTRFLFEPTDASMITLSSKFTIPNLDRVQGMQRVQFNAIIDGRLVKDSGFADIFVDPAINEALCKATTETFPDSVRLELEDKDGASRSTFNSKNYGSEVIIALSFDKTVAVERIASATLSVGGEQVPLDPTTFVVTPDTENKKMTMRLPSLPALARIEGSANVNLRLMIQEASCSKSYEAAAQITVDKTLPSLVSHNVYIAGGKVHVDLRFQQSDLAALPSGTTFTLSPDSATTPGAGIDDGARISDPATRSGNLLRMSFSDVSTGSYSLVIEGLVDVAGNEMPSTTLAIAVGGNLPSKPAKLVEFPEFIEATNPDGSQRRFNPADHVQTRVARLFYFRDAHRVAQIVNRITESYNRAAVDQADQRFQESDRLFEDAKSNRQLQETAAIRLAETTRARERELRDLNEKLVALRSRQASFGDTGGTISTRRDNEIEIAQIKERLRNLEIEIVSRNRLIEKTTRRINYLNDTAPASPDPAAPATDPTRIDREAHDNRVRGLKTRNINLENEILDLEFEQDRLNIRLQDLVEQNQQPTFQSTLGSELGIDELLAKIEEYEGLVQSARAAEDDANDRIRELKLTEDRLAKERFRLLSTARNKDPDTFAPGNPDSIDPVARVSVSVIGEGLLQLRGPINGINKIRLMIHQIDSPRGQVKVDVNTVQINGEDQRRMEKVAGKVEAHISLGRHMTMQSLELLRKAIVQEASRIASQCPTDYGFQAQEEKYLTNFFGGDFVAELRAMDSEFLKTGNKILSLNSMDVVSPSNAMFIFLLAKNDVRRNIYANFLHLVDTELPEIEWEYRKQLELYPHKTRGRMLPLTRRKVIELDAKKRVCLQARQRYTFRNFKTFFEAQGIGNDTLNPAQREFIRLAQIFKAQMIAESEVKQRVVERAMVEDESLVDIEAENKLNELIRKEVFEQIKGLPKKLVDLEQRLIEAKKDARTLLREGKLSGQNYLTTKTFVDEATDLLRTARYKLFQDNSSLFEEIDRLRGIAPKAALKGIDEIESVLSEIETIRRQREGYAQLLKDNRRPVNKQKLLDHLIEEKIEKQIELLEGTRAQISVMDNYIKRLVTALEDDFQHQFYDPSFIRMREAARSEVVNFSQADRTTLLMNNRDLGIVHPTATMEFDLPRRDILIVETLDTARAIAQDYGALLQDPTYLAVFDMLGGGQVPSMTKKVLPGLPSLTDEYSMGLSDSREGAAGSALQGRIQDPAIYQFETGTGFEIRPVIQPDGHSLAYDFHYMYTSDVREPVRADEKHLGRVKRHFIDTQVQTSSFEMREVGRYFVGLKAARTSNGVPGLQNIPVVGRAFRPAPSAESSLQQNIVLAKNTVYPTLYDLMGLRWAKQVVDLNDHNIRYDEFIVRGRSQTLESHVFDETSRLVDDVLGIRKNRDVKRDQLGSKDLPNPLYRPDLYRRQQYPPTNHPGGMHTYDPYNPNPVQVYGSPVGIPVGQQGVGAPMATYGNNYSTDQYQGPANHYHPGQHPNSYPANGYGQPMMEAVPNQMAPGPREPINEIAPGFGVPTTQQPQSNRQWQRLPQRQSVGQRQPRLEQQHVRQASYQKLMQSAPNQNRAQTPSSTRRAASDDAVYRQVPPQRIPVTHNLSDQPVQRTQRR